MPQTPAKITIQQSKVNTVRLSRIQVEVIKKSVLELFGPDAKVFLFGSRVDDSARGGDIDLLVSLTSPAAEPAWDVARLQARIIKQLGERKIDVVLEAPNMLTQPIHKIAHEQGIPL